MCNINIYISTPETENPTQQPSSLGSTLLKILRTAAKIILPAIAGSALLAGGESVAIGGATAVGAGAIAGGLAGTVVGAIIAVLTEVENTPNPQVPEISTNTVAQLNH